MTEKQKTFLNQVVLITGASMGIGRALALAFAKEGAILVLAARSKDKLEELAQAIKTEGAKVLVLASDVTYPQNRERLIQTIDRSFGRLDILVNNAGKGLYAFSENAPLQEVRDLFELNLFAVMDLTEKGLPLLKKSKRGMVINISSIAGYLGIPRMSSYCASKSALNLFSEALRIEWAHYGIHVLNVYPGITDTGFSTHAKIIDPLPVDYKTYGRGLNPTLLAKKILKAARKRKREEWVSLQNRFVAFIHSLFPSLFDWILRRFV